MEDLPLGRITALVPEFAVKDLPLGRTLMMMIMMGGLTGLSRNVSDHFISRVVGLNLASGIDSSVSLLYLCCLRKLTCIELILQRIYARSCVYKYDTEHITSTAGH